MSRWIRSFFGRSLALLQIALLLSAGCTGGPLAPTPGTAEYLAPGMIRVPGGVVNAAGGNLLVERTDLTLDSLVGGTLAVGAVYNSSLAGWTWSFGDALGRRDVHRRLGPQLRHQRRLPDGAAIPGTHWVKVDSDTVQTKGGLAHDFDGARAPRGRALGDARLSADPLHLERVDARDRAVHDGDGLHRLLSDRLRREPAPGRASPTRAAVGAPSSRWDAVGPPHGREEPTRGREGLAGHPLRVRPASGALTAITNSEGERDRVRLPVGRPHPERDADRRRQSRPTASTSTRPDRNTSTRRSTPTRWARARGSTSIRSTGSRSWSSWRRGSGARFTWAGLRPATVTLENGATTDVRLRGRRSGGDHRCGREHDRDHLPARRARSGEPALAGGRPDRGHAGPGRGAQLRRLGPRRRGHATARARAWI